jgi:anaerobic magnesium-protoporphyrin IX monomethyl ester cyclase
MIDLVIINPSAAHGVYGTDIADNLIAIEPPLWCRLIAGYVRDRGYSVRIIDAEALHLSPERIASVVDTYAPRLVCIASYGHQPSASTQQMVGAGASAKAIKARSDVPIIMVGGHVAALPERTLREEAIDYACNGEGPATIVGLLEEKPLPSIPGLVWGIYNVNPSAPLLDVNELHGNAWDLLPMERYRAHNWQCFGDLSKRQPYASIYTSLGCPYKCSFCCINAPFQSNRYRMRSPTDVVDEIGMLYSQYGVKTFKIVDEMFVLNERHYTAICNELIESGFGDELNIWAYARVDTVKPHTLAMFKKAGIRWLALGIESGSKHVRDGTEKALRTEDIVGVVRSIQSAGINVIGNYIFGLPDDDMSSMQATLDLALECNTEFANFYSAMAYPGSKLYDDALKGGAVLPATWSGYSQHNADTRPLDTEHVDAATVLRFRDDAFVTYFTDPSYLSMIERKFGAETLAHVRDMTKFRLKRKLLETADA